MKRLQLTVLAVVLLAFGYMLHGCGGSFSDPVTVGSIFNIFTDNGYLKFLNQSGQLVATMDSRGMLATGPDIIPTSPNAFDDEFDGAISKWTWVNGPGTATAVTSSGTLVLSDTPQGAQQVRALVQSVSGVWTITAKMTVMGQTAGNPVLGIVLRSTSGVKVILYGIVVITATYGGLTQVVDYTNPTTYFATPGANGPATTPSAPFYLRVQHTSANTLVYMQSTDGINYKTFYTEGDTAGLGFVPNQAGLGINNSSAAADSAMFVHYIRMTVP